MPKKNNTDEKKCTGCGGPVTPNAVILQTGDFMCERCVEYMHDWVVNNLTMGSGNAIFFCGVKNA